MLIGKRNVEESAIGPIRIFFLQVLKQEWDWLKAKMLALRCCCQQKVKDFSFVTAYIGAIALNATHLAYDTLRKAIIALVFRKSKR